MQLRTLTIMAALGLALAACGKKTEEANGAADASPAAVNAAADASNVTSIPGYTPDGGNAGAAPAGNAP
jgi:hypothetical protein